MSVYVATVGPLSVTGLLTVPTAQATLTATYATTSATAVCAGVGSSLTSPGTAIRWTFTAVGDIANPDAMTLWLYRGTAGIPAAGSAPNAGDVAVYGPTSFEAPTDGTLVWAGQGRDTGLTPGTVYYYYWAVAASNGATGTLGAVVGGGLAANATTLILQALA
jgi:hypothetical protein